MKKNTFKEWEFSLFFDPKRGIKAVVPKESIDLKRLISIYKSPHIKEKSEEVTKCTCEFEKAFKKLQLPFITPTGVYHYREGASCLSYNSSLLPLDIDNLTKEDAVIVQSILSTQQGCILATISPRGEGVKALIHLSSEIDKENHYRVLHSNLHHIAKNLNIEQWSDKIDSMQFTLPQPFLIAYNEKSYFNEDAEPTQWSLVKIEEKKTEYIPPTAKNNHPTSSIEMKRIHSYLINLCERVEAIFSIIQKGERHLNIWRVGGISSLLHYAPYLEPELKGRMFYAVETMYSSEREFISANGKKTLEDCWEYGKNQPNKRNEVIELIIEECKEKKEVTNEF